MNLQDIIDKAYPQYYDYDVEISKEKWIELLQDNTIFTDRNIEHLKCIYSFENHAATSKEVSQVLGGSPHTYTRLGTHLAQKVSNKLGLPTLSPKSNKGGEVFWYILFYGQHVKDEKRGTFEWKLKPALADALKELYPDLTYPKPIIEKNLDSRSSAVWSAAAILTYQSYTGKDMEIYHKVEDITELATRICNKDIDNEFTEKWCNGDNFNHMYAYLKEGYENFRRVAAPGEFAGVKERPENIDRDILVELNKTFVTVKHLYDFIEWQYATITDQLLVPSIDDHESILETAFSVVEGRKIKRNHYFRERNRTIINKAIQRAIDLHGEVSCEVCGFNFEKYYGERGKDFIEGHHKIPLSQYEGSIETSVEDIALVCSNCHRMIHRREPWLSMEQLKQIIND